MHLPRAGATAPRARPRTLSPSRVAPPAPLPPACPASLQPHLAWSRCSSPGAPPMLRLSAAVGSTTLMADSSSRLTLLWLARELKRRILCLGQGG